MRVIIVGGGMAGATLALAISRLSHGALPVHLIEATAPESHAHPGFDVLSQPLQATAIYCGLNWLPPFAMHCTFICDDETLEGQARHYKQRLLEWQEAHHG